MIMVMTLYGVMIYFCVEQHKYTGYNIESKSNLRCATWHNLSFLGGWTDRRQQDLQAMVDNDSVRHREVD